MNLAPGAGGSWAWCSWRPKWSRLASFSSGSASPPVLTGALSLLLWEAGFWVWQAQLVFFAVLSVVAVLLGRRFLARSGNTTDEPLLNQRGARLIGRTAVLEQPIVEGRGRIRLDADHLAGQRAGPAGGQPRQGDRQQR